MVAVDTAKSSTAMNSVAAAPGLEVQRRRVSAEAGAYRLQAPLPPPELVGLRGAAVVRRDPEFGIKKV
jgi:hypothetical protein